MNVMCNCGQVKISSIKEPVPGVQYCIFGNCPPGYAARHGGPA